MNNLDEAYNIIDKELEHLSKESDAAIDFNIYSTVGQQALKIIQDHVLITFRSANIPGSMADIQPKGLEVLKIGGIKNYLDKLNNKTIQGEAKEALEIEKLQHDILYLKNQLTDYKSNKRRTSFALIIAIIALLLQLLSLFKAHT